MEIKAKTILRKYKMIDSWFISSYGMNLYRGCAHGCVYCDGRSEKYQVAGDFGEDIAVKVNAIEILEKELAPSRRRKALKKCFFLVAGGVGDGYQKLESEYLLTRKALGLLDKFGYPVHILTKSLSIKNDFDILKSIQQKSSVIVSMSFSSVNPRVCRIFEPGVPSPEKRLELLSWFKQAGIPVGVFLMPVLPFISDTEKELEASIKAFENIEVDFLIFGGLTLKAGRQKDFYMKKINREFNNLIFKYNRIYPDSKWGSPINSYYHELQNRFWKISRKHSIPLRVPQKLFEKVLDENGKISVMLDQLAYFLNLRAVKNIFYLGAREIGKSDIPVRDNKDLLGKLKNLDAQIYDQTMEILQTGTSVLYQKFINNQ